MQFNLAKRQAVQSQFSYLFIHKDLQRLNLQNHSAVLRADNITDDSTELLKRN